MAFHQEEQQNTTTSLNYKCKKIVVKELKSVNLKYITVEQLDDDMIVPPSDRPMFILINWE